MTVKEVLDTIDGNVKLGAGVNYIYCGEVKDLTDLFKQEEATSLDRITNLIEAYTNHISNNDLTIDSLKYDIESLKRVSSDILDDVKKTEIIKGKTNAIKKAERNGRDYRRKLASLKEEQADFCPIYDREVVDVYPSTLEPNTTIVIFKGGEIGKYWTIKEYNEKGGK